MADNKQSGDAENKVFLASVIEASQPDSEEDLLLLTLHAVLLKNGFKIICAGSFECSQASPPLEGLAMPTGWNKQQGPDCYQFAYLNVNDARVYNIRALRIEDKLYISILGQGENERNAAELQIHVPDEVQRGRKPVTIDWLANFAQLWKRIQEELLLKIQEYYAKGGLQVEAKEQQLQQKELKSNTTENLLERRPLEVSAESHFPQPPHPSLYSQEHYPPRESPFAYGDADRLPGHPGMGGMLMDPLRSGGMGLRPPSLPGVPRGSVPPGARFDPYGPLTEFDHRTGSQVPRRSFDPNPDHLRRPNFDDDMFM